MSVVPSDAEFPLLSPLVEQAVEVAMQWHEGTYRKSRWRPPAFEVPPGERLHVPATAHAATVGLIVQRAGWDDVTVAAAYLHDVLEDANRFQASMRREALEALVGPEVVARVLGVSEQKKDAEGNWRSWRVRKEDYVAALAAGTPEAAAISLADKLHNLWSINQSLDEGKDVFEPAPGRKALSAGPAEQRWFHRAVLEATRGFDDPRLVPMRARLEREIERFEALTAP